MKYICSFGVLGEIKYSKPGLHIRITEKALKIKKIQI